MGDTIVEINGEEYVKLEDMVTMVLDHLVDGTSPVLVDSERNAMVDEVCRFLDNHERKALSVLFRKLYLMRRFPGVFK